MSIRRLVLAVLALALALPSAASAAAPVCAPASCGVQGQSRSIVLKRSSWDKKASVSRTKGRKTSLRVSVKFAPKGSKPRITVAGPRGFKRVITKSTTWRNVRPGRYTITAAAISGKPVTTFATYQRTRATLRKGVAGWVGVRYMQRVQSTTRVAAPSAIKAVSGDPNGVRDVVVDDPDGLVRPGTVLAAGVGPQTPGGLLLEVAEVTRSGRTTIARGGPAPLTAIGPQAEIVAQPKLSMSSDEFRRAVEGGDPGRTFKRMLPRFTLDGQPKAFAAAGKNKGFGRSFGCSTSARATFDGDVDFDAGTDVGVSWGGWLSPLTIRAHVGVKLRQEAKLQVSIEGAAKCQLQLDLLPKDHRFSPWTFTVGPVPVVIVPKLNFQVTGEASVGARLTSYVEQSLATEFGVAWDGSSFGPYGKAEATFSYTKPNPAGTLNIKAAVGPKLMFDIYDVAGPYLTADLFMQLKADTSADPWWRLSGGLQAGGGLRFKVWKFDFDKGIRDIWSEDWTIAKADKPPVPAFTTATLPDADNGKAYRSAVVATSRRGPVTYALTSGRLPDGLKLSSDGKLSGTPTGFGTHTFELAAKDSLGQKGLRTFTIKTKTPPAAITTTALPAGRLGAAYTATLQASGSLAPYAWSLARGELPAGLELAGGTISGTPSGFGASTFTVRVRGVDGGEATRQYTLSVEPAPLEVTTQGLQAGKAYVAYAPATLAATGGRAPYTWSAAPVPAGLSLSAEGVLEGTPTGPSTAPLAVTVRDADGRTQTASLALTIADVDLLTLSTSSLSQGMVGVPYEQVLSAVGGRAPYTFSADGSVPAGLSVASGRISGTPSADGDDQVTLKVTDVDGRTATRALALKVLPPGTEITTGSLPAGQINESYEADLAVLGGTAPYSWSVDSGSLQAGLTLDSSTGRISGTPTVGGTVQVTFKVVGADAVPATKQLSLTISSSPGRALADISCSSPDFCMAIDSNRRTYTRDASGTWTASADIVIDGTTQKLSCGADNACLATVIDGSTWEYDGTDWTAEDGVPDALYIYDVDCVTASYCVAAGRTTGGYSSVWKWNGSTWGSAIQIAAGNGWVSVTCTAVNACVLTGNPSTATFNGTAGTVVGPLTPTTEGRYLGCLSMTQCFVGGPSAGSWTFDGASWTDSSITDGSESLRLAPVACSRGAVLCAAGGATGGNGLWTFDGTTWTRHAETAGGDVRRLACAGASFCVAVTSIGQARTWNGTSWSGLRTFARG